MADLYRKIRLLRLSHVYYTHRDLEAAHTFNTDFGLATAYQDDNQIYYRGYGQEPFVYSATKGDSDSFGGAAFTVESMADLEVAVRILPKATPIHTMTSPGGGSRVTFHDPIDGFPFHLIYGQSTVEISAGLPELDYNFPQNKNRAVNRTQRFKQGPAPVHKLGHFGCCVTNFSQSLQFYTQNFNFKPSDIIHDSDDNNITVFMHLDRGMEQVDHHSFFFYQGPEYHIHHASFEVHDFDTQALGHQWLEKQGYELVWGIGRHVLGSQIFDYWRDKSGFILEHYADGDLVDETTEIGREEAGPDNLHIWGPPLPATFLL